MYFTWTGNPFVDAGTFALAAWVGKEPEGIAREDLTPAIDALVDACVDGPLRNLIFGIFPNNPVTNPSVKAGDKARELKNSLLEMLARLEPLGESGNCMACGRRSANYPVGRSKMPLTGSGGNRNFFSFAGPGADICGGCALAAQFLPLVVDRCGRALTLLHTSNKQLLSYWYREKTTERKKLLAATGTSDQAPSFKLPENYLFEAAQKLVTKILEESLLNLSSEPVALRLYTFFNGQQGQFLEMYDLPAPVFTFLAQVKQIEKAEGKSFWWPLVRRGFEWNKKNEPDEQMFRLGVRNSVYRRLLNGKSIVSYFILRDTRQIIGDWRILSFYLKEVRAMEDERIAAIRNFADRLAAQIQETQTGKKRLAQLEMARDYAGFRRVLLRMVHDRVAHNGEEPLIFFDEYVEYLFPNSAAGWNETRDLIFFRLYEKLHAWLVQQGLTPPEHEEEDESIDTSENRA